MNSILVSVKKMLGIVEEYTQFDTDLILHINSVFTILTQLGVGPKEGYSISGDSNVWSEFTEDQKKMELVKSYMALKVRLIFDPPQSSGAIESIKNLIAEMEWRLNVNCDVVKEE